MVAADGDRGRVTGNNPNYPQCRDDRDCPGGELCDKWPDVPAPGECVDVRQPPHYPDTPSRHLYFHEQDSPAPWDLARLALGNAEDIQHYAMILYHNKPHGGSQSWVHGEAKAR